VGAESFSKNTELYMCGVFFLVVALQYHHVMLEYVDMNFANHPYTSAVILEHLIKTRLPMEQHHRLKDGVDMCRSIIKAFTSSMDKTESRIGAC
jgi:hypothetical protein